MWMETYTPYTTYNQQTFNELGINCPYPMRRSTAKAIEILSIVDWLKDLNNNQEIDINN
ncbi:unnamed protein product [Cunninghamella echinulata]